MGTSFSGPTLTLSILKALHYIFITSLLEFYLAVGDLLTIIFLLLTVGTVGTPTVWEEDGVRAGDVITSVMQ